MSARGDARKRLAEQEAAPVSFANRQSDTLADKFLAYLYAQNTVNQYSRHAEPLARIAAEHYGAVVAAERERIAQAILTLTVSEDVLNHPYPVDAALAEAARIARGDAS